MRMRDDRTADPEDFQEAMGRAGMDIEDSYEVEFDDDEEAEDEDEEEDEEEEDEDELDDDYDEFVFGDEEDDD